MGAGVRAEPEATLKAHKVRRNPVIPRNAWIFYVRIFRMDTLQEPSLCISTYTHSERLLSLVSMSNNVHVAKRSTLQNEVNIVARLQASYRYMIHYLD